MVHAIFFRRGGSGGLVSTLHGQLNKEKEMKWKKKRKKN
jgi:hypothetical protein